MTIRALASKIAKLEGKKSQARIGDIREILGILADFCYQDLDDNISDILLDAGYKRAKKRKKT